MGNTVVLAGSSGQLPWFGVFSTVLWSDLGYFRAMFHRFFFLIFFWSVAVYFGVSDEFWGVLFQSCFAGWLQAFHCCVLGQQTRVFWEALRFFCLLVFRVSQLCFGVFQGSFGGFQGIRAVNLDSFAVTWCSFGLFHSSIFGCSRSNLGGISGQFWR